MCERLGCVLFKVSVFLFRLFLFMMVVSILRWFGFICILKRYIVDC